MKSNYSTNAQIADDFQNEIQNDPVPQGVENDPNLKINIISRGDIPTIHQIEVNGEMHNLGTLKDFRKQSFLSTFIPEKGRLSMSWVNLKPNEILSSHQHSTASMIIICEGEGEIIGDCNQHLEVGDIAAIPPQNLHGFIGRGENGFWGLSIQFEGLGLYENRDTPRVEFINQVVTHPHFIESEIHINKGMSEEDTKKFNILLENQHYYEDIYRKSDLVELVKSSQIQDPFVQERLLEALNYWGNWFQRIIFARAAIGGELKFQNIAEEHICSEAGHNTNLLAARGNKPVHIWDPILEASAAWFYEKMFSATDAERTILVHFVLEGSGEIFHREAATVFSDLNHFRIHGEEDGDHFEMGCQLLKETTGLNFDSLNQILQRGWNVMEVLCNRIAYLAVHNDKESDAVQ